MSEHTNDSELTGRFGHFGGQYVAETLMPAIAEVKDEFFSCWKDPEFNEELTFYLREFVGRSSPLFFAKRLTDRLGGCKDLSETGGSKPYRCP